MSSNSCPGTGSLKTARVTGDLWCPTCFVMFRGLAPGAQVAVPEHPVKAEVPAAREPVRVLCAGRGNPVAGSGPCACPMPGCGREFDAPVSVGHGENVVPDHVIDAPADPTPEYLANAERLEAVAKTASAAREAARLATRYQPRHGVPASQGDGLQELPWKHRNE
jgi:hypothetical protein